LLTVAEVQCGQGARQCIAQRVGLTAKSLTLTASGAVSGCQTSRGAEASPSVVKPRNKISSLAFYERTEHGGRAPLCDRALCDVSRHRRCKVVRLFGRCCLSLYRRLADIKLCSGSQITTPVKERSSRFTIGCEDGSATISSGSEERGYVRIR